MSEHVVFICPACMMTVKPPVTQENAVTWCRGGTRYYAHRKCEVNVDEELRVDSSSTMVATDWPTKATD